MWILPPGNAFALAAAVAVFAPPLLSKARPLPLYHLPPVLGVTVFMAIVPWVSLPYRPEILWPLLIAALMGAYAIFSVKTRTYIPALLSLGVIAVFATVGWFATRPD